MSRAGGRGLSDGVEAEGLERFRLTRQYWLGKLRGNPAVATEELKHLERIGPARQGAECQRSDSALRVCEKRCGEERNAVCHSLASPLVLEGGVRSVADDTSGEEEASVNEIKAEPYLFPGRSGADAMERKRNEVRACPACREWRAALLWPQGL